MALNKEIKSNIITKFGKNDKDSGNIEVQVALLTEEIKELTEHLKLHKKDIQARRNLLKKVYQRSSFLKYLKKHDYQAYIKVITDLKIRQI